MAEQQIYFRIEGDANGIKQAMAEAEAAYKRLVNDLTRKQADIGALRAAQEGLARTTAALDEAKRKLDFFKRSAEIGGSAGAKAFTADIRLATAEVSKLSALAATQKTSVSNLTQSLTAAGINTRTLATENARLAAQIAGANITLNTRRQALQQLQADSNAAAASTTRLGGSIGNSTRDLIRMAAEVFAVGQALKGVRSVIDAGIKLDALNNTLLFASGSSEAAADSFGFLREETNRLGISFVGSAKQFAQMNAAAVGTSLEGSKVRDIFTAVAEASRVMGLQTFQTERAFLALQQIISKGTVQSEELRQQLGEQLPGAFQIAARAMGVTTQELSRMLKAGEVLSDDFLPKFAAELRKTVGSALPSATQTFAAEVERLKNVYVEFLQEVSKSGALDALRGQVVDVTKKLRDMAESGELQVFIQRLADIIGRLAGLLGEATRFAIEHGDAILNLGIAYAALRVGGILKDLGLMVGGMARYASAAFLMEKATLALTVAIKASRAAFLAAPWLAAAYGIYKIAEAQGEVLETHREQLQADAKRERNLRALKDAALEAGDAQLQTAEEVLAATDVQLEKDIKALQARKAVLVAQAQEIDRNIVNSNDADEKRRLEIERATLIQQSKNITGVLVLIRAEQAKREKNEGFHTQVLKKELEAQTLAVQVAVDAQKKAYSKAVSELETAQKKQRDLLKANQQFARELEAAIRKGQGEEAKPVEFLDVSTQVEEARRALQSGDFQSATEGIGTAQSLLKQLAEAGTELPGFINALAGEIERLSREAAAAEVQAAEANIQTQKDKLLELQALEKEISLVKVDADVDAADAAIRKLVDDAQAFLDSNPLLVNVVAQGLENIGLGIDSAPKRAHGGPIFGPGTGTSDSILARLSNNEHVLTSREVAMAGGHAEIYRLRALIREGMLKRSLPGFAGGGAVAVGAALSARLPQRSGPASIVNLTLPGGGTFELSAQESVAAALQKAVGRAALMHGRRR